MPTTMRDRTHGFPPQIDLAICLFEIARRCSRLADQDAGWTRGSERNLVVHVAATAARPATIVKPAALLAAARA